MTEPVLVVDRPAEGVVVLRLNRPEAANALTFELMDALGAALADAEDDRSTRAAIITGTGERTFCGGMDLRAFAAAGTPTERDSRGTDGFDRLLFGGLRKPVIGAANGTAVGGGLEVLLGCDLIVAAEHARFGLPEVSRGLLPGGNGTFLGRRIPLSVALEVLLTGEPVDSGRALAIGLVNRVVPAGEVMEAAVGLALRIAANAPLSIAAVKELAWLAPTDLDTARRRLKELTPSIFGSADAREGATAFVEKRPARWTGA